MVARLGMPLLLAAVALYVGHFNATHTDRVLLFPLLDLVFPSLAGHPGAQGEASVRVLWGLCAVSVVWSITDTVRIALRRRRAANEAAGE